MGLWQGAWRLARFEIGTARGSILVTAILFVYMSVLGMVFMDDLFRGDLSRGARWAPDFIYLSILPNMGFLMNRAVLQYWRDDPYSRKLAVWRTMPISLKQIVLGRIMVMGLVAVPIALLFFGLQYGLSGPARESLSLLEYMNFALFWLAYALFSGIALIYCELGFSGRTYFIICCGTFILYAPLTLLLWLSGQTAIERTIHAAASGNWLPALCAWTVALIGFAVGRGVIERRIQSRDLLN